MNKFWYEYIGWIAAAGLLGFALSTVFAGILRLPRNLFLIPYIGMAGLFCYAYVRWSGLSIGELIRHNWIWGVVGAILLALDHAINSCIGSVPPISARWRAALHSGMKSS